MQCSFCVLARLCSLEKWAIDHRLDGDACVGDTALSVFVFVSFSLEFLSSLLVPPKVYPAVSHPN
eukprot:scaffold189053_cov60-Attheya_sp.AAC.3